MVVAVLVGLLLLKFGLDGDPLESTAEQATTETSSAPTSEVPTTTTVPESTTTTAPETRRPSDITVLVANASGRPGAASDVSEQLRAKGFSTADPANAAERGLAETKVYFTGEDRASAEMVAVALGLEPSAVEELPDRVPTADGDMRGASVLVVLGTDLAS